MTYILPSCSKALRLSTFDNFYTINMYIYFFIFFSGFSLFSALWTIHVTSPVHPSVHLSWDQHAQDFLPEVNKVSNPIQQNQFLIVLPQEITQQKALEWTFARRPAERQSPPPRTRLTMAGCRLLRARPALEKAGVSPPRPPLCTEDTALSMLCMSECWPTAWLRNTCMASSSRSSILFCSRGAGTGRSEPIRDARQGRVRQRAQSSPPPRANARPHLPARAGLPRSWARVSARGSGATEIRPLGGDKQMNKRTRTQDSKGTRLQLQKLHQ